MSQSEKKTVITGNGAFSIPLQKTTTCLESWQAFISPVFTVSVQKLDSVTSSPSLYKEKNRSFVKGEITSFTRIQTIDTWLAFFWLTPASKRPLDRVYERLTGLVSCSQGKEFGLLLRRDGMKEQLKSSLRPRQ